MPSLTQLLGNPVLNLDVEPLGALSGAGPTVTGVVTFPAERRRPFMGEVLPGHLAVISSPNSGRPALDDEFIRSLSDREAAGAVLAAGRHEPWQFTTRTRALAERLGLPLLTTTSPAHAWRRAGVWIMKQRAEEAEQHLRLLGGLVDRLPLHLTTDTRAMQRITEGLADALTDGQVLVIDPERGVLAAAPQSAPGVLAGAVIRQAAGTAGPLSSSAAAHTRLIALDASTGADTMLAVASGTDFDAADAALVKRAATLLGLVDQAQRDYGTAGQAAQAARLAAFQLLMIGEVTKAQRVLEPMAPRLFRADEARVYVVDAVSAAQRESTVRRCETATAGRALVVRCPAEAPHVIIVEPQSDGHDDDLADVLTRLVTSLPGHRMGGSRWQPLADVAGGHEEAVTALSVAAHRTDSVVLGLSRSSLIDLLDPAGAQQWAAGLLAPLHALNRGQRDPLEQILPLALAYPYTHAAATLGLSRNKVAVRMGKVGTLLGLDLKQASGKAALSFALDVLARAPEDHRPAPEGANEQTLAALLEQPAVRAWGEALLNPLVEDDRDLIATLQTWLERGGHEETAESLGISEWTVGSHLGAVASATERNLRRASEVRDLAFALYATTGRPRWEALRTTYRR